MPPKELKSFPADRISRLRACARLFALIASTALLAILQRIGRFAMPLLAHRMPMLYHGWCCRLLGLEMRRYGEAERDGPVLYVCNHASYLDVPVLGGVLDAQFVAKAEVAAWPIIGALSRLQDTVFIERRPRNTPEHRMELMSRLANGRKLVLFPEGTSGDGNRVLPFKSALFSAVDLTVDGDPVKVQPVTVAYSRLDGRPMGRSLRPYFAWYGDMTLVGHLWTCLGFARLGVDIVYHEPVVLSDFESRKALASHCREEIARGLSDALSGRLGGDGRPSVEPAPKPGSALGVEPGWPRPLALESGQDI